MTPTGEMESVTARAAQRVSDGAAAERRAREARSLPKPQVAVLTGGGDRPYALGLAASLIDQGICFDFIGSDHLEGPEVHSSPLIRFLNLRGDARTDAAKVAKVMRVLRYYGRLLRYAATAEPKVFHVLWNNKIEAFDRTLVLLYYRLLGKRIVFTVHNVNAGTRDGNDGLMNRLTLRSQYHLSDHLFVHTRRMKEELQADFAVAERKITVIPFGINSTVPDTPMTASEARQRLGLSQTDKVLLFFGHIAPYKGLEYLVEAIAALKDRVPACRLVIAGRPKGSEAYWASVSERISSLGIESQIIRRIEYIPDEDTEVYFKAADAVMLPYTHVFQSGVLFLAYNFGLPAIASDVASLREDIVEGETGFVCRPRDSAALADAIERFFESGLYASLAARRSTIRRFAAEHYSWTTVGSITGEVYRTLTSE